MDPKDSLRSQNVIAFNEWRLQNPSVRIELKNETFTFCFFEQLLLININCEGCTFTKSVLSYSSFFGSTFNNCDFESCILVESNFAPVESRNKMLSPELLTLSPARLFNCNFSYAYASGSSFNGCTMEDINFLMADLNSCDLRNIKRERTDWSNALTQHAQFDTP